jgi:hypothetical protein
VPVTAVLILAGLAGIIAIAALAVAPLLLPWPNHVRWLVAANAAVDRWGPGAGIDVFVDEVRVADRSDEVVWITRAGATADDAMSVAAVSDADRCCLDRWAAAGTPLLQVTHRDGTVSLHCPTRAVVGLQPATDSRAAQLGDVVERWLHHTGGAAR